MAIPESKSIQKWIEAAAALPLPSAPVLSIEPMESTGCEAQRFEMPTRSMEPAEKLNVAHVMCSTCGAFGAGTPSCDCAEKVAALIEKYGATHCACCGYDYSFEWGMPTETEDYTKRLLSDVHEYVRKPCEQCSAVYAREIYALAWDAEVEYERRVTEQIRMTRGGYW